MIKREQPAEPSPVPPAAGPNSPRTPTPPAEPSTQTSVRTGSAGVPPAAGSDSPLTLTPPADHSTNTSVRTGRAQHPRLSLNSRPILFLALLFLTSCTTVTAPEIPPSWTPADAARPLTHNDAVDLAARWAPTAAAWQARLSSSRAALAQESLLSNPVLGASWEDLGLFGPQPGPIQHTFTIASALEQLITRKRRMAAASHELQAEEASILTERNKLAVAVYRAYDGVLAASARADLQRELEAVANRQRDAMAHFASTGGTARFAQERAEAELAAASADRATAENDARIQELELAFALGFAEPVHLQLADPLTTSPTNPLGTPALLDQALNTRPELIAARARVEAELERLHIQVSRAHLFPSFLAGPRFVGKERSSVLEAELPLPIFDTGAIAEQSQSAALQAAAADLRIATQTVISEFYVATFRLTAATTYLNTHATDLATRRSHIRESTERLFVADEATYDDLVLARRDEVEARLALLTAKEAVASASVDLRAALGTLGSASALE